MPHKTNLADYVNVNDFGRGFNNTARDFCNKLHNGWGDTITKTLDKKLSKGILIVGTILTLLYATFLGIGDIKARELEKEAIRARATRKEFYWGYGIYHPNGAIFKRYNNLLDTIRISNTLYIDFNRDGNAEVIISPIKMYNSWDGKTDAEERMMFRNANECIKEIKKELGIR